MVSDPWIELTALGGNVHLMAEDAVPAVSSRVLCWSRHRRGRVAICSVLGGLRETAVVNFVEGQSRLLKLYLAVECAADPCVDPAMICTRGGTCRTLTDLVPVGSKVAGIGRWGHFDMAGNVNEWTLDWFVDYVVPCVNCANLTAGSAFTRVTRGGAFTSSPQDLATEHRVGDSPTVSGYPIGFRCARSL
jgi:Sulfatase-modifying factor enzyme 1